MYADRFRSSSTPVQRQSQRRTLQLAISPSGPFCCFFANVLMPIGTALNTSHFDQRSVTGNSLYSRASMFTESEHGIFQDSLEPIPFTSHLVLAFRRHRPGVRVALPFHAP